MGYTTQRLVKGVAPRNAAWSVLPVFLILFVFLFSACSSGGTSTPTTKGGKLNVGLAADLSTLDPLKSSSFYDRQVMLNIYDTLVRVDAKNNVQPDLATSWQYTTPTELVFTLRTDVTFQDGTPFNADAVVFNINRILTTPSSPRLSEIASVKDAAAVDSSHVRFDLKAAFAPLLLTLTDRAGMILSPTAVQKLGDATLATAPTNAGSGPFMFKEWVKGDHLTVVRNPHYWQKDSQGQALPYLSSVTYHPITNGTVEFTNLQTGNIDVADAVDPSLVSQAKANPNLIYRQQASLSFAGFELNTKAAPFDNVNVRQAVAWGVNRNEILNTVLKGVGVLAQGPLSPGSWAYDSSFSPYSYDVNKAKAALQQAGLSNVGFTLLIPSGSPLNTQEAQFIQSELQPVGITVTIKEEVFATLLDDTAAHNYQAALVGWSGRPDPDGNMYAWFHTGGGFNDMQYSNSQVDALLEDGRASSDQSKRTQDYIQAQKLIVNDAPYIFINHGVSIQASSKKVQNFLILPTGIMEFASVYVSS
jgi:peptide/nickel transport system substrate-binding protein